MAEKEPLLLLSGLLSDGALWRAQVEDLADMAVPVPPDLSQDDSISGMALRALAAAPPRFAVAGLSMGGYVALEIMRRARAHFAARTPRHLRPHGHAGTSAAPA